MFSVCQDLQLEIFLDFQLPVSDYKLLMAFVFQSISFQYYPIRRLHLFVYY